jgi:hypothetical protein
MTRRLHNSFDAGAGLTAAAMLSMILKSKPRARRLPTAQEIAAQAVRAERQRWNDEVKARKDAKQIAKKGYSKP